MIERKPGEKGYVAYSPTLPGCFCRGESFEEARRNLQLAIEAQVESLVARGQPINGNDRLVHVGELTVAVPILTNMDVETSTGEIVRDLGDCEQHE